MKFNLPEDKFSIRRRVDIKDDRSNISADDIYTFRKEAREWVGTSLFALFAIHHILSSKCSKSILICNAADPESPYGRP